MKKTAKQNSSGFTIIELIFASLIFSLVMTVILVTAFQIGRIYYKGVSISNTNEAARTIVDDISNDVRFAQLADASHMGDGYFCIGLHRYTFALFKKVTNEDIAANRDTGVRQDKISLGCPSPDSVPVTDAKQLLGPDMQLNDLQFVPSNGAVTIHVHIIFYGADDKVFTSTSHPADTDADHALALKDPDARCSSNLLSSQFCAAVDLQTKVLQRL